MSDFTHVYLITGFLGSGKTTLLNRIIKRFPKNKKLTLLVNEFGEVGVDGTLVEGDDIDMMEISKGSIFCVCVKTDFIKGLYELNSKVQPDVMLIESTGVANPSDLKKDLKDFEVIFIKHDIAIVPKEQPIFNFYTYNEEILENV